MADIEKVTKGIEHCLNGYDCKTCPYATEYDPNFDCIDKTRKETIELLKEQQAEIDRLKAEKNRVIEQIKREIHLLLKESGCVKDDVGIAQYQWLINGYQSALDMIEDGEQE